MKKTLIVALSAFLTLGAFAQSVQEGVKHLYADRLTSAKTNFEKMLASNPNNLEAVYWLGQTHIENDDVAAARAVYEKALATNGNAPLVLVGMGHVELLENKTSEARQRFESAISLSKSRKGNDPNVLNAIGRANVDAKAGDVQYAISKLTEATQRDAKNAEIWLNLGNAYRKAGNGGQAVTSYMEATRANPQFAPGFFRQAKIYETQRNWEIFTRELENAVQADPSFAPAYYELYYYTLLYPKDFTKAEEYANKFIANSDPSVENDYIKAQTSFVQKKYDEAIATARNIVNQAGDKANPRVYRLLGYAHLEKGDTAGAKTYVDQFFAKADEDMIVGNDLTLKADVYAKEDPSVIAPLYLQAAKMDSVLANQLNFLNEGIERFKASGQTEYEAELRLAAYELKPTKNPAELFQIGLPYYRGGNYKKADSLFTEYAKALPDSIYGHYWSALSLSQIDSTMEQGLAVPAYQKTLEIASTDKERLKGMGFQAAGYLAGYYNNVKGDKATAITYLQKALEFDPTNTAIQKNIQILQQKSPAPAPRSSTTTKKPAATGK